MVLASDKKVILIASPISHLGFYTKAVVLRLEQMKVSDQLQSFRVTPLITRIDCIRMGVSKILEEGSNNYSLLNNRLSSSNPINSNERCCKHATPKRRNGKLIRLRINRHNHYPVPVHFKTSEYYEKADASGRVSVYQRLKVVSFHTPEDLILAIFLHEFSHYLDHLEGRNGRYKQTKADKFALQILQRLDVIKE